MLIPPALADFMIPLVLRNASPFTTTIRGSFLGSAGQDGSKLTSCFELPEAEIQNGLLKASRAFDCAPHESESCRTQPHRSGSKPHLPLSLYSFCFRHSSVTNCQLCKCPARCLPQVKAQGGAALKNTRLENLFSFCFLRKSSFRKAALPVCIFGVFLKVKAKLPISCL